jgi:hypothetical protein
MDICHEHNTIYRPAAKKPFGIRVSIKATDSFARIIGKDWEREHWYASRYERDRALEDMASQHVYSRNGDRPTLIYEPIER